MRSTIATYVMDDGTQVGFEVDGGEGFGPAGPHELAGELREAIAPAVQGAAAVLARIKDLGPDEIEVKFGIKVTGAMNWIVARGATEGNFEVTASWKPGS